MSEPFVFQPGDYRIVVVDDEQPMLAVLRLAFNFLGYQASFFGDAREALEEVKTGKVDLILTDFHMPQMSGLELLQKCRETGWKGKVMIMSGQIHTVPRAALTALGVLFFLEKPFSPSDLEKAMRITLTEEDR